MYEEDGVLNEYGKLTYLVVVIWIIEKDNEKRGKEYGYELGSRQESRGRRGKGRRGKVHRWRMENKPRGYGRNKLKVLESASVDNNSNPTNDEL